MLKKIFFALAFVFLMPVNGFAALQTQAFNYNSQGTPLEGYLAFDDQDTTIRPGILIVHDWMGEGKFTEEKARDLAKDGYVALAVDIYGKGIRPKDAKQAGEIAGKYKNDRVLLRERIRAAYDALIATQKVDPKKIVIIGYCFGGMTALELGRSGAPVAGIVSFHGTLSTPTPQDAKKIKGRVLILHGADDPHVSPEEIQAFRQEMRNAGVDMKFVSYPDAVHSFTNPAAGRDKLKGVAYNAKADQGSWMEFQAFLKQLFPPSETLPEK